MHEGLWLHCIEFEIDLVWRVHEPAFMTVDLLPHEPFCRALTALLASVQLERSQLQSRMPKKRRRSIGLSLLFLPKDRLDLKPAVSGPHLPGLKKVGKLLSVG